ncbi:MAG: DMT family transporter [Bacillota bacterium]|jgi:drug/metabolite transporter (DMT)-like permease
MSIEKRKVWDYLGLIICVLSWSTAFITVRSAAAHMTPMTMAMFRLVFAALFFLPLAIKHRHTATLKEIWDCKGYLVALSLLGSAGFMLNMCIGLTYTTASNAALINGTNPIVTVLMATLFLKAPLKKSAILPMILALAGAIILIWFKPTNTAGSFSANIGDLFFIANVILWSAFSIILIPFNNRLHWAVWGFIINAFGAVVLLLLVPFFPISFEGVAFADYLKVSYAGLVCGGLATMLWNNSILRLGIATAALFNNLNPLFAVIFSVLLLGETMVFNQIIGAVLILGSLITYTLIDFIKYRQWQKAETEAAENTPLAEKQEPQT